MHHHFHHFFGRGGQRFGGRVGGRGFGPGGFGEREFGMGRKLSSADLQLLILKLLEEKPCHGYEIIKLLDERSNGFYAPSPGMVYPALTYLEEIGHATVSSEGTRKLYQITPDGARYLEEHRSTATTLMEQLGKIGERMDQVRRAFTGESGDADGAEPRRGSKELHRARHELKRALMAKWNGSHEEQQRIAAILARAAAEILGD